MNIINGNITTTHRALINNNNNNNNNSINHVINNNGNMNNHFIFNHNTIQNNSHNHNAFAINRKEKVVIDKSLKNIQPTNHSSINCHSHNYINSGDNISSDNEILLKSKKVYKCKTCDKVFKRRTNLNAHAKVHTGFFLAI